jgi:hypothetical protein
MTERDHDPLRQDDTIRGDAIQEPEGVDQERANALDITAVPGHGALARPGKATGNKTDEGDGSPANPMGSPAADPQKVR